MKNIAIELEGSSNLIKWMEWRIEKLESSNKNMEYEMDEMKKVISVLESRIHSLEKSREAMV